MVDLLKENLKQIIFENPDSDWEMGIDEAGRGPVLGNMVFGGCSWPIALRDLLKQQGLDDSKVLTHEQRVELLKILQELKDDNLIYFEYVSLHPQYLSNQMLRNEPISLNKLSFQAGFTLIDSLCSKNDKIKKVYLDAVGPTDKYREILSYEFKEKFPYLTFVVENKADSKFPIVSAASIIAKVTRDNIIENWEFKENQNISKELGSGYPSDPNTKLWLQKNFNDVFGFPNIVRWSWSTIQNILEEKKLSFQLLNQSIPNSQMMLKDVGKIKGKNFGKLIFSNNLFQNYQLNIRYANFLSFK